MRRVFSASDARNRYGDMQIINATNSAIRARGLNPDLGFAPENLMERNRKVGTGKFAQAIRAASGGANDHFQIRFCVLENRSSHRIAEIAGSTPAHAA